MGIITAILPLALILILLGTFFSMYKVGKKYMTLKVTHTLLVIYLTILVLATAFVPFFTDNINSKELVEQEEMDQALSNIYRDLYEGNFMNIDPKYLVKVNNFEDYKGKSLHITTNSDALPQILVERSSAETNISVFMYMNGLIIDGFDFTDKLKPYQMDLQGNTLSIIAPNQHIRISATRSAFPVRQFTGETMTNHFFSSGGQFIYLRVPKDIELEADDHLYLEYIDNEI